MSSPGPSGLPRVLLTVHLRIYVTVTSLCPTSVCVCERSPRRIKLSVCSARSSVTLGTVPRGGGTRCPNHASSVVFHSRCVAEPAPEQRSSQVIPGHPRSLVPLPPLEEQWSKAKVARRTSVVFELDVDSAILFESPAPRSTLGVSFSLLSSSPTSFF